MTNSGSAPSPPPTSHAARTKTGRRKSVVVSNTTTTVEHDLRQGGCALASLLFNIFFAAVTNVLAYARFKADKDAIDAFLVHLRKKRGGGGAGGSNRRSASPGDAALGHSLR